MVVVWRSGGDEVWAIVLLLGGGSGGCFLTLLELTGTASSTTSVSSCAWSALRNVASFFALARSTR